MLQGVQDRNILSISTKSNWLPKSILNVFVNNKSAVKWVFKVCLLKISVMLNKENRAAFFSKQVFF